MIEEYGVPVFWQVEKKIENCLLPRPIVTCVYNFSYFKKYVLIGYIALEFIGFQVVNLVLNVHNTGNAFYLAKSSKQNHIMIHIFFILKQF